MLLLDSSESVADIWPNLSERLTNDDQERLNWLAPLAYAMSRHPELCRLHPFVYRTGLHLSRCTKFPFSDDCPHAVAVVPGRFRVYGPHPRVVVKSSNGRRYRQAEFDYLGEGDVLAALDLMMSALPPRFRSAIEGDIHDLRYLEGKLVLPPAARQLHAEAFLGRIEMVEAVLNSGIDIDIADYCGFTALMYAVLSKRVEMVEYLLSRGAQVCARTADNETAYSLALVENNSPEIVIALADAGGVF